jgi:hypothetical protein
MDSVHDSKTSLLNPGLDTTVATTRSARGRLVSGERRGEQLESADDVTTLRCSRTTPICLADTVLYKRHLRFHQPHWALASHFTGLFHRVLPHPCGACHCLGLVPSAGHHASSNSASMTPTPESVPLDGLSRGLRGPTRVGRPRSRRLFRRLKDPLCHIILIFSTQADFHLFFFTLTVSIASKTNERAEIIFIDILTCNEVLYAGFRGQS